MSKYLNSLTCQLAHFSSVSSPSSSRSICSNLATNPGPLVSSNLSSHSFTFISSQSSSFFPSGLLSLRGSHPAPDLSARGLRYSPRLLLDLLPLVLLQFASSRRPALLALLQPKLGPLLLSFLREISCQICGALDDSSP